MKNKFLLGFMLGLAFLLLLGAFTRDWTESTPTDSTFANQIDDFNRYLRVDMSDRLKNMFYGFIAGENTLSQHCQYLQFYEQASISQPSAGYGRLGTKAVGGKCELFWHDEDGDEIEVTEGGKWMIGYGTASQALMWNTTQEDGDGGRESQIRATGEQSGGERTTLGYLEFSHDGASDDEKGRFRIVLNDGDDTDAPSITPIEYAADGTIDVTNSVSVLDEDAMGGDSATKVATQQSIKAYVDNISTLNGSATRIYRKYFTGTLDSDDSTSVAHGVTVAQILHVSVICYNSTSSRYEVSEHYRSLGPADYSFQITYDATNVVIGSVGTDCQGQAYRIKVDYY